MSGKGDYPLISTWLGRGRGRGRGRGLWSALYQNLPSQNTAAANDWFFEASSAPETAESAAPVSAVATITAAGQKTAEAAAPLSAAAASASVGLKAAEEAAPLSAVATVTATGEAADGGGLRDPGSRGKPWLYEVQHREFPAEAAALAARKVAAVEKRRATMAAKKAARAALNEDEDEELIWLLVA